MAPTQQVRSTLTRALTAWSVGSMALGGALLLGGPGPRRSGFARQSIAWGAVDLGIAALASRSVGRVVLDEAAEARSLRRLLLLNAVLDIGYVAVGARLRHVGRVRGRDVRGDGVAVVVQGAFLLLLDTTCAWRLRTTRV